MGEEGGRHLSRVDQSAVTWVVSVILRGRPPLMEGDESEECGPNKGRKGGLETLS